MGDFYMEMLIEKKPQVVDMVIRVILIAITVVSFVFAWRVPFGFLIPILCIVADCFLFRMQKVEYEYTYVNGEMSIDKILNKARRKHLCTVSVHEMEEMRLIKGGNVMKEPFKIRDCSSGDNTRDRYLIIQVDQGERTGILFEPDGELLNAIRAVEPRKVIV